MGKTNVTIYEVSRKSYDPITVFEVRDHWGYPGLVDIRVDLDSVFTVEAAALCKAISEHTSIKSEDRTDNVCGLDLQRLNAVTDMLFNLGTGKSLATVYHALRLVKSQIFEESYGYDHGAEGKDIVVVSPNMQTSQFAKERALSLVPLVFGQDMQVEGHKDSISIWVAGYENVLRFLTVQQVKAKRDVGKTYYRNAYYVYDPDCLYMAMKGN
jgi:hypothetical protein